MAFHDVQLPDDVEQGAQGGPAFRTTVLPIASGFEKRNQNWANTRGAWDIGYGITTKLNFSLVLDFFYARKGRLHSFRFKDWTDFEMARQVIGQTDTTTANFQIFKRYTSGGQIHDRTLEKIVSGSVSVWVNNVAITEGAGAGEYQINLLTGVITLGSTLVAQSGTDVEVLCEFDVPVRFDTDQFNITAQTFDAGAIPTLPIIEVRGE